MENVELKEMTPADLEFVKEVYDYYILHSTAVFYLHPLTISELGENIRLGDPRYLAYTIHANNQRCGFCYISKFKPKEAFDVTVEITSTSHLQQEVKASDMLPCNSSNPASGRLDSITSWPLSPARTQPASPFREMRLYRMRPYQRGGP